MTRSRPAGVLASATGYVRAEDGRPVRYLRRTGSRAAQRQRAADSSTSFVLVRASPARSER
jgi:hypothetical protein